MNRFKTLYLYIGHHKEHETTAEAFVSTFGASSLPDLGGVSDPPRTKYSNKKLREALSENKLFCLKGKLSGGIRASSMENFGQVRLFYSPQDEQAALGFIALGTEFIEHLDPVFANIRFSCHTVDGVENMGKVDLKTLARVGLNGLSPRTWFGGPLLRLVQPFLQFVDEVQECGTGVRLDLLPDPFSQPAEDLLRANQRCRRELSRLGLLCDDSKRVKELWRRAPEWKPLRPTARPNSYLVEHTVKGGAQAVDGSEDRGQRLERLFEMMNDQSEDYAAKIRYEMAFLLTHEDLELRAAACLFYDRSYAKDYHKLVPLLNEKMDL